MDREQEEIQFLGFFGIVQESFNIASSWKKIFAQITLALILPLSFVYLAHIQISKLLFRDIKHIVLDKTPEGTGAYDKISNIFLSKLATFLLFKIGYFIFFIVLALLSTSAVVYAIACIYTGREISLRNVMSVVPKVWKRLIVTFLWNFAIMFAFNVVSLVLLLAGAIFFGNFQIMGPVLMAAFVVLYLAGFLYITIVWHVATVVSVLEESYGLKAMAKSKELIKGKMGVAFAVFLVILVCFYGIEAMFKALVVQGEGGIGGRIGYGIVCVILLSICLLFGLIAQTIVYLVCKSYHHQNIDKSLLADHLGGYLGYVTLKPKNVQLEHFRSLIIVCFWVQHCILSCRLQICDCLVTKY